MSYIKQAQSLSLMKGSDNDLKPRRSDVMLATSRLGQIPSLQHAIAWTYGAVLVELHFSMRGDVWTARVKADFGNIRMVTWIDVPSFVRCVEAVCEAAHMGWFDWKLDKRQPKR